MFDPAESDGLVLDTSVWINLLATNAIDPILKALVVRCHAPEQVIGEVKRDPLTGIDFSGDNHPLRHMSPRVTVLALDGVELDIFFEIVGAPAGDALGDGEAAAIALAATRRLDLVIDDKKARRILRERFSHVRVHWTVDLLRADLVVAALGRQLVDECFERALCFGRMHVPRV